MLTGLRIPTDLIKRPILEPVLCEVLKGKKVVILLGARQTGKSSLIYLLIKHLSEEIKISPKQIFYFDVERINTADLLNRFTPTPEEFIAYVENRGVDLKQQVYVFIDEVQYLTSPAKMIKYLHDHHPNLTFVISGSSSLDIKQKFTDRLTGRNRTFRVQPLSFAGFLKFTKHQLEADYLGKIKTDLSGSTQKKLNLDPELTKMLGSLFENFVVIGGYPGVVRKAIKNDRVVELESIYSDYIRKDIRDIANIEDTIGYNRLIGLLAGQIGGLVNESELTSSSALSRPTVRKYLALLEGTFVMHRLPPYYRNPRQEFVKMPKIFFEDTGMRNVVLRNFDPLSDRIDRGRLAENAVFLQIKRELSLLEELFFWRTQGKAEVDFVIRGEKELLEPIEVKYRNFSRPQVPSGLRAFIKRYKPRQAWVVTRNFWGEEKVEKTPVFFLPAWAV